MSRARAWVGIAVLACATALGQEPEVSSAGYIEMPVDDAYVLTSPTGSGHNWGRPVFVRYLTLVAREWLRRHPEGPRLRIGDMSKPDASAFPPHKTHKDGLTADLFTSPKNVCHVNFPDQELTLELAELLHELGANQILYNGKRVIDAVPVAKSWPQHDDHFHVVIDPNRVPPDGDLVLLPQRRSRTGSWISAEHVQEDRTGLELGWQVLGRARISEVRVLFDDADDQNGVLHDSGELKRLREPVYALPISLDHGATYRWKVEVTTDEGVTSLDWQTLQTDLIPPDVEPTWPRAGDEVETPPTLTWRYSKRGAEQVSYSIEIDSDRNHKRGVESLGPFPGAATSHALTEKLRKNRTYYWRVLATDAHGNVGRSNWAELNTAKRYDADASPSGGGGGAGGSGLELGRVTASSLNLREGPGTQHKVLGALPQDTRVEVLARDQGWLRVRASLAGGVLEGYVSERYVQLGSAE
ncbi:MAG: SH3 domain-containing protein [Planctomycetota bacterium]